MGKTEKTSETDNRYANSPVWQAKKADAEYRASVATSFDDEVSDDWMGDLEDEEA